MDEKRLKIVVGINTLTSISQPAYSNHCQMWYRFGKQFPNVDFILNNPRRMSIDAMRNMTAKVALENNCDYILFIDDDVLVPFDALARLLSSGADISAGWTLIRGYPYKNMFFKYADEARTVLQHHDFVYGQEGGLNEKGLIECDAVGFSCCLIKVELLKKVEQPYFITGPYNTEDIYFCVKAQKQLGHENVSIVVDPAVITSHILGLEAIDPITKGAYKDYYERLYPEVVSQVDQPEKDPLQKLETRGDINSFNYEDLIQAEFGTREEETLP